jgi:epsilon-lactone hydrolase
VDLALARDWLLRNVSDYAGGDDPAAAELSPQFADLRGIAPLLIQCGSNEVLLDDATRLAATAATAEVAVQLDVTPEVGHVFQASEPELDEANAALARTGGSCKRTCGSPSSGHSAALCACESILGLPGVGRIGVGAPK